MLKKFKEDRKYKFDKVICCRETGNWNIWVDWCHGKEVEVLTPKDGIVTFKHPSTGNHITFSIEPSWCVDVTDIK